MPFLPLKKKEVMEQLGMLPQAHTCENTLELPNYFDALCAHRGVTAAGPEPPGLRAELREVVEQRLLLAIVHCTSYGLDQVAGEPAGRLGALQALPGQRVPGGSVPMGAPFPCSEPGEAAVPAESSHLPASAKHARRSVSEAEQRASIAIFEAQQRGASVDGRRADRAADAGSAGDRVPVPGTAESTAEGVAVHGSSATSLQEGSGRGGTSAANRGANGATSTPFPSPLRQSAARPPATELQASPDGLCSRDAVEDWNMEESCCDDFEEQVKQLHNR